MSSRDFVANWLGHWVADDGRTLEIERRGDRFTVTVLSSNGRPFAKPSSAALPARWTELRPGTHGLRAEVGAAEGFAGAGPTYDLEFVAAPRSASPGEAAGGAYVSSNVTMGLYDDYDEDFGVPWAFPLAKFHRAPRH